MWGRPWQQSTWRRECATALTHWVSDQPSRLPGPAPTESSRSRRDRLRKSAPATLSVVERRGRAVGQGPLNTPLNRLMMRSQSSGDGKERWILAVTQQYTGSFNPARRLVRDRAIDISFATSVSLIDNSITRRHAVVTFASRPANQTPGHKAME
jgi:hypothetical protein